MAAASAPATKTDFSSTLYVYQGDRIITVTLKGTPDDVDEDALFEHMDPYTKKGMLPQYTGNKEPIPLTTCVLLVLDDHVMGVFPTKEAAIRYRVARMCSCAKRVKYVVAEYSPSPEAPNYVVGVPVISSVDLV